MKKDKDIDLEEIKSLISEVEKTKKYNHQQIAEYHSKIFGKEERPDNKEACSIMQMRKIKAWYQDQKKK